MVQGCDHRAKQYRLVMAQVERVAQCFNLSLRVGPRDLLTL